MEFNDYVQQGIKFFQEKKIGQALENLEAALKLQPNNEDVRKMIMMIRKQADAIANADQALVNEIKQRTDSLGITDLDKAIAEYTETLKRNTNDASAKSKLASVYYIRGLTFASKGEHIRAIEDYTTAINNEPNYPLALNKRGRANLEMGNHDQAIKDFEKLIQLNPNDDNAKQILAGAYRTRGIAYDKKGAYNHAIPDFEMVLKLRPDDNTTRELLEMAKAEIGKNK